MWCGKRLGMKLGGRPRFCRKSWVDSRVGGSKLPGRFQCPFFNNQSVTVNYALSTEYKQFVRLSL